MAALARVAQANAARAPNFKLGGSLGLNALTVGTLTNSASVISALLASVSVPLFDGGALRAQGAALMFARVTGVWIDDDEEGLDRTMAALDRGLNSAARWAGFLDDLCSIPACIMRGPRRRRRERDEEEAEAA